MRKGLGLSIILVFIPATLFMYALNIQQNINIWPWDSAREVFLKVLFGQMSKTFLMYAILVSWGGIVYLLFNGVREIIIERLCVTLLIGVIIFSVAKSIYPLV